MNELFPVESVTMDSPRLAWMKRHGLCAYHSPALDGAECEFTDVPIRPWTCCSASQPIDILFGRFGVGNTEEEACLDYAMKEDIPNWTQQPNA